MLRAPAALIPLALLATACAPSAREAAPVDASAGTAGAAVATIDLGADEVRVLLPSPGGPAERAGFRPGDRLLAGDGEDLSSEADAARVLSRAAPGKPIFFEVARGRQVLTLPLDTPAAGWHLLSGGTLRGLLFGRAQPTPPPARGPVELELTSLPGRPLALRELRGAPLALLFWGTFSPASDEALRAFGRACSALSSRGLACLAVDTLDLFTAAGRTAEWAADVMRVRREVYPRGELALDLPMRAERALGVQGLPTLVLLDPRGREAKRWTAFPGDLAQEIGAALDAPRP